MALECRNGRSYYYESRRVGGRVLKQYCGAGACAVLMAQCEMETRQERNAERDSQKCRLLRQQKRTAKLREWLADAARVTADAMEAAGWHQHKHEWRRKRGARMDALQTTKPDSLPWYEPALRNAAGSLDKATAAKAANGDASAIPAVDEYLKNPAALALWGDTGRRTLQRWIMKRAGECLIQQRAMLKHAEELRDRLTGPNPDALTQLVAERVVMAWFVAYYIEERYAVVLDTLVTSPTLHKLHKTFLAQLELVNRNLMSACKTLAKVRRAKFPDMLAVVSLATPPMS
jgi:hypothetical protein